MSEKKKAEPEPEAERLGELLKRKPKKPEKTE